MIERLNELDKLRIMLDKAQIPYEDIQEKFDSSFLEMFPSFGVRKYSRNQIIYGRYQEPCQDSWKLDGICQYGSYGSEEGLIETYGELGVDEAHNPRVLSAEEVFEIIKADWEKMHQ